MRKNIKGFLILITIGFLLVSIGFFFWIFDKLYVTNTSHEEKVTIIEDTKKIGDNPDIKPILSPLQLFDNDPDGFSVQSAFGWRILFEEISTDFEKIDLEKFHTDPYNNFKNISGVENVRVVCDAENLNLEYCSFLNRYKNISIYTFDEIKMLLYAQLYKDISDSDVEIALNDNEKLKDLPNGFWDIIYARFYSNIISKKIKNERDLIIFLESQIETYDNQDLRPKDLEKWSTQ